MALEKIEVIDLIEVMENNYIQVRRATRVMEDGVEISKTYHRHVLSPGDSLDGQDAKVVAVAKAAWA